MELRDVEICFPVAKNLELSPSTNVVDVEKQIEEKSAERSVRAKPSSKVGKWALLDDVQPPLSRVRVGSVFPPLSIACYDVNGNQIPFATTLEVAVKVQTNEGLLFRVEKFNKELSNHTLTIKDMLMESGELDKLRPTYEATLVVCSEDPDKFSVLVPCEVIPGYLQSVKAVPPIFDNQVLPGYNIKEFILEMFDQYGNHVIEGTEVLLKLDGFSIQDQLGIARTGCIDLSGLLNVTAGYENSVSISVLNLLFQTEKRVLIMHTPSEAACGMGTTLGSLKFNRGLLGFHDSRETKIYRPSGTKYICDSKDKFHVISETSNFCCMMAGVTDV